MQDEASIEVLSLADGLMLQAFMLQVSLELGRGKPDPGTWARGFVDELYMRIRDARIPVDGCEYADPIRELAMERIDALDRKLSLILAEETNLIRD